MRAGGLVVCLLLAGCAEAAGSADSAGSVPDAAVLGHWELEEFRQDGAVVPLPDDGRATLLVEDGEAGRHRPSATTTAATTASTARRIASAGLGGTEMACAPELMAPRPRTWPRWPRPEETRCVDGVLVLTGADVELRYRLLPRSRRAT